MIEVIFNTRMLVYFYFRHMRSHLFQFSPQNVKSRNIFRQLPETKNCRCIRIYTEKPCYSFRTYSFWNIALASNSRAKNYTISYQRNEIFLIEMWNSNEAAKQHAGYSRVALFVHMYRIFEQRESLAVDEITNIARWIMACLIAIIACVSRRSVNENPNATEQQAIATGDTDEWRRKFGARVLARPLDVGG